MYTHTHTHTHTHIYINEKVPQEISIFLQIKYLLFSLFGPTTKKGKIYTQTRTHTHINI